MPFSQTLSERPFVAQAQRLRQNPITAYGIAVAASIFATGLRAGLSGYVIEGMPFSTYYPAIVVATFFGGWRAGLVCVGICSIAAWFLFLPPVQSWVLSAEGALSLVVFVLLALTIVTIMGLLNAAVDRIVAQEENQHTLIESVPNGIVVTDKSGTIRLVNKSVERIFGYERRELVGESVDRLVPRPVAVAHSTLRQSFHQSPRSRQMGNGRDLSGLRKDGSEFPVEVGLNPLAANGGNAVLATVIDISERKRLQDQRELLIDELRHRTKNLFMVAQVVVARSLEEGRSVGEAKSIAVGRLAALANAYAALGSNRWEGLSLAEIARREFAGFIGRLSLSGCDIVLRARAVEQFSMIVHELATNAMKYGALSNGEGVVAVEGRAEQIDGVTMFCFVWREAGGPPVEQPTRKGFGSTILLDATKPLADRVALTYATTGLVYQLDIPLSQILEKAESGAVLVA